MQEQGYNGHKNYETWAVSLFLDGNYTGEGDYLEVLELARYRKGDEDHADQVYALASDLREFVEGAVGDHGASLAADLLNAAISEVDWHGLAEDKLAEIDEDQS